MVLRGLPAGQRGFLGACLCIYFRLSTGLPLAACPVGDHACLLLFCTLFVSCYMLCSHILRGLEKMGASRGVQWPWLAARRAAAAARTSGRGERGGGRRRQRRRGRPVEAGPHEEMDSAAEATVAGPKRKRVGS